jgi:hypothetical protein
LPFLEIRLGGDEVFNEFVGDIFATDRWGAAKGMVEVIL